MDGWMTCDFTSFFNSISVVSGGWSDDDERLCAMELHIPLKRSSPQAGPKLRTARSVGQRLTTELTGLHLRGELLQLNGITVQILCIGTDRSQQTVQTKIRLLLKKQSDQGLRCLPFHQHLLDALMQCYIKLFYF